ncbi:MAG TPA: hypothetical protein VGD39_05980 [Nocardioides sp.]
MPDVNDPGDSHTRRGGAWGLAFVVLLLVGAGMASVPGGQDSVAQVRRFYGEHTGVVLLSQLVELLATLPLVLFVRALADSTLVRSRRDALLAGGALVVASVLTLVPPLLLVVLHDRASDGQVHALAVLSDLTDVLLFATITAFAACAWAGGGPGWFRWSALLVAVAAAARALEILFGGALLEVVAPVAFILLAVASSVLLMRGRRTGP